MKLHIVGGFLGSGKTTGIMTAAKHLIDNGIKVGVVTNDRGKHLVDTMFFENNNVLTIEIAQGCFRCSIDEFAEKLYQLEKKEKPDVVFAESVGTCSDLVATVIEPLTKLEKSKTPPSSFSVFTDSQLLLAYLQGVELPFSEIVLYTFEKQIEETKILIVNKADLLNSNEVEELVELAREKYPDKLIKFQNSKHSFDVVEWIDLLDKDPSRLPTDTINIDYSKYGFGEVSLAWLDQKIVIDSLDVDKKVVMHALIEKLQQHFRKNKVMIGHLKFFISDKENNEKISVTTLERSDWEEDLEKVRGKGEMSILINARIEIPVVELTSLVDSTLTEISKNLDIKVIFKEKMALHPSFPTIPYRFSTPLEK